MSLKERLKPYIFSFGLICSLFYFSNIFAVDNPTWTTADGSYTTGSSYEMYYDENDYLTLFSSFADSYTYPSYPFTPEKLMFGKTYNWNGAWTTDFFTIKISGTNYYLAGSICDSSHTVSSTIVYGSSHDWCYVDRNELDLPIKFFAIHSGGNYTPLAYNSNGLTKTDIDNYFGLDSLETNGIVFQAQPYTADIDYSNYWDVSTVYDYPNFAQIFPLGSSTPPDIDGVCGSADGTLPSTIPIPDGEACSSGTVASMHDYYSFEGIIFDWSCLGSGNGISVNCESLPFPESTDGVCGPADGGSSFNEPEEEDKCLAGSTGATTTITLTGWSWTCFGLYGGNDVSCSSTYSGGGSPPEDIESYPIPTPTDCESYSGIDQIFCNFGNIIQGLFLPSTSKLIDLQNTLNSVGNVFPFNYLRAIGSVFSNTTISEGTLTLTMFGTTETINPAFWTLPIFSNFKLFATILILLMFTFWAINYIKHFFK